MIRSHPRPFRPLAAVFVLALFIAIPFATGRIAHAAPPPPPTVTLSVDGQPAPDASGCVVALIATWQADEVHGAFVDTRLYEVTDAGDALRGAGFRIPDEGSTLFRLRNVTEAPHTYRFELVRGGQERVLASDSALVDVSCP